MSFVTVNQKCLVVIPKNVRDKCNIYPGDKLKVVYDPKEDAVVMKKIKDVKTISAELAGMWADNKFDLQEMRSANDDRIKKLLEDKL
ncbi:MAG: AbrB/MazE/SpoVT family DNA-binding domain-containing protein [Candidatus Altiarchaeota archaeon]|nr:AbrB/MazE/SpoVT family DNA-binding domain-containing protein [Candidatus Altiarchaeota archaeon]